MGNDCHRRRAAGVRRSDRTANRGSPVSCPRPANLVRLVAAVALTILIATLAAAGIAGAEQPARFVPLLGAGDGIPPIPLLTQDGRAFTLADFRGRALVVSFIYTRCRDARMCPLVSAKFARIQAQIGTAPIHLLLISLDPSYDTPAVLRAYGQAFGQDTRRWTLATGSRSTIDEITERLGIASSITAPGNVVHTEAAIIVAPDGRIARTIDGNAWDPSDLLAASRATLSGGEDRLGTIRTWLAATLERCGGGRLALGGGAILAVFGFAFVSIAGVLWRAFAVKSRN